MLVPDSLPIRTTRDGHTWVFLHVCPSHAGPVDGCVKCQIGRWADIEDLPPSPSSWIFEAMFEQNYIAWFASFNGCEPAEFAQRAFERNT